MTDPKRAEALARKFTVVANEAEIMLPRIVCPACRGDGDVWVVHEAHTDDAGNREGVGYYAVCSRCHGTVEIEE